MDIIKYNISKDTCKKNKKNQINESKGILLGLILYISKHISSLSKEKIQINSNRFKEDVEYLFPQLNFVENNSTFTISIKSKLLGDINITNIEYIDTIKSNKIYLLPYYDKENPIIMYNLDNSNKNQNIEKIKEKINTINYCYSNNEIESDILNYYLEQKNPFNNNLNDLIDYINQVSSNIIYKEKIIEKKIKVPTPYLVPIPFQDISQKSFKKDFSNNKTKEQINEIKKIITIKKSEIKNIDNNVDNNVYYINEIKKLNEIIDELSKVIKAIDSGLNFSGGSNLDSENNLNNKLVHLHNNIFRFKKKNII